MEWSNGPYHQPASLHQLSLIKDRWIIHNLLERGLYPSADFKWHCESLALSSYVSTKMVLEQIFISICWPSFFSSLSSTLPQEEMGVGHHCPAVSVESPRVPPFPCSFPSYSEHLNFKQLVSPTGDCHCNGDFFVIPGDFFPLLSPSRHICT